MENAKWRVECVESEAWRMELRLDCSAENGDWSVECADDSGAGSGEWSVFVGCPAYRVAYAAFTLVDLPFASLHSGSWTPNSFCFWFITVRVLGV